MQMKCPWCGEENEIDDFLRLSDIWECFSCRRESEVKEALVPSGPPSRQPWLERAGMMLPDEQKEWDTRIWPIRIICHGITYQFGTKFYGYEIECGDLASALEGKEE